MLQEELSTASKENMPPDAPIIIKSTKKQKRTIEEEFSQADDAIRYQVEDIGWKARDVASTYNMIAAGVPVENRPKSNSKYKFVTATGANGIAARINKCPFINHGVSFHPELGNEQLIFLRHILALYNYAHMRKVKSSGDVAKRNKLDKACHIKEKIEADPLFRYWNCNEYVYRKILYALWEYDIEDKSDQAEEIVYEDVDDEDKKDEKDEKDKENMKDKNDDKLVLNAELKEDFIMKYNKQVVDLYNDKLSSMNVGSYLRPTSLQGLDSMMNQSLDMDKNYAHNDLITRKDIQDMLNVSIEKSVDKAANASTKKKWFYRIEIYDYILSHFDEVEKMLSQIPQQMSLISEEDKTENVEENSKKLTSKLKEVHEMGQTFFVPEDSDERFIRPSSVRDRLLSPEEFIKLYLEAIKEKSIKSDPERHCMGEPVDTFATIALATAENKEVLPIRNLKIKERYIAPSEEGRRRWLLTYERLGSWRDTAIYYRGKYKESIASYRTYDEVIAAFNYIINKVWGTIEDKNNKNDNKENDIDMKKKESFMDRIRAKQEAKTVEDNAAAKDVSEEHAAVFESKIDDEVGSYNYFFKNAISCIEGAQDSYNRIFKMLPDTTSVESGINSIMNILGKYHGTEAEEVMQGVQYKFLQQKYEAKKA